MISAKVTVTLAAVAALGLAGCTNPDGTNNNTGTGALVGAGLGAAIGGLVEGNAKGAAVGAAIGTAVGGGVGAVLDAQERQLRQSLAGTGARIVNTGDRLIVVLPEAITFDFDSAEVKPSSRSNIAAIAQSLQDYPDSRVRVEGHTDNVGSTAYNRDLSLRRAQAVRAVLIQNGVRGGRIRAVGRGENEPIASNASAQGRAQNRRVEIEIIPN